ncbi:hypothetical protein H8356DRAFT_1691704 [Neocallimastix lanati (nom. inval.)]|nr:hypothetical protein H8356DRAFT_1691704 [Neocallimastix sp. JGI-2020a]
MKILKKYGDEICNILSYCCCFLTTIVILGHICYMLIFSNNESNIKAKTEYRCDYINFSANTKIQVYSVTPKEELLYTIEGDILKAFTNPLTLYDERQNHKEIMYAGDKYNYFSRNTHIIQSKITNEILCDMEGHYQFIGDTYDLYVNDTQVGTAKFHSENKQGEVKTMSGDLIAEYYKAYFRKDYTVRVKKGNNIFTDETLLMIIAAYICDCEHGN